jgi:hypothetical protein
MGSWAQGKKLPKAPRGCPCGRGAACICRRDTRVASNGTIKPKKKRG